MFLLAPTQKQNHVRFIKEKHNRNVNKKESKKKSWLVHLTRLLDKLRGRNKTTPVAQQDKESTDEDSDCDALERTMMRALLKEK